MPHFNTLLLCFIITISYLFPPEHSASSYHNKSVLCMTEPFHLAEAKLVLWMIWDQLVKKSERYSEHPLTIPHYIPVERASTENGWLSLTSWILQLHIHEDVYSESDHWLIRITTLTIWNCFIRTSQAIGPSSSVLFPLIGCSFPGSMAKKRTFSPH